MRLHHNITLLISSAPVIEIGSSSLSITSSMTLVIEVGAVKATPANNYGVGVVVGGGYVFDTLGIIRSLLDVTLGLTTVEPDLT
jgi:hypothetical protein